MKEEKFSEMLNKYKKTVQISFEEYKEKTKEDSKEVFQYMVYKMANDDIKIFEKLEIKDKEINRLNNIISECANEILKELQENNHLSYGVALAIRQKLINYNILKGDNK